MTLRAYTPTEQTKIRFGIGADIYALPSPADIVWQFRCAGFNNSNSVGSISVNATVSGSHTEVREGMTVIITRSSDYVSDLKNDRENSYVTYARKDASSGVLFIGSTDYRWFSLDYVTVLADFRPKLVPTRWDGTEYYHFYDIGFASSTNPKPLISGLNPSVTIASGTNANVSFTPTFTAMNGGSISSYRWWFSDGQTDTVANPSKTFNTGSYWAWCEATDNDGAHNSGAVMFAVIQNTYDDSSLYTEISDLSVNRSLDTGATLSATLSGGWGETLEGSPILSFFRPLYHSDNATTAIQSNVLFFGFMTAVSDSKSGGNRIEGSVTIQAGDIANYLATESMPAHAMQEFSSPSRWGELSRLTIGDAIHYLLSEFVINVPSLRLWTSFTDYRFPTINSGEGTIWDVIKSLALRSGAVPFTTAGGEIQIERSIDLETDATARSGATTIADFTLDDFEGVSPERGYTSPISQIQLGAGSYNTTTDNFIFVKADATAQWLAGSFRMAVNANILQANLTDSEARSTAGSLAYNHFANAQPTLRMSGQLLGGYFEIYPTPHLLYTMAINSGDLVTDLMLDGTPRFALIDQTITRTPDGVVGIDVNFKLETGGYTRFAIATSFVPYSAEPSPYRYPVGLPNSGFDTGIDDFLEDVPVSENPYADDPTVSPNERERRRKEPSGVYKVYVPMSGGVVNVPNLTQVDGTTYDIRAMGEGLLQENTTEIDYTVDFDSASLPYSLFTVNTDPLNNYTRYPNVYGTVQTGGNGGNCIRADNPTTNINTIAICLASITLPIPMDITSAQLDIWSRSIPDTSGLNAYTVGFYFYDEDGNNLGASSAGYINRPVSTWETRSFAGLTYTGVKSIIVRGQVGNPGLLVARQRYSRIDNIIFEADLSSSVYGDAISKWDKLSGWQVIVGGASGLLVNGTGDWRTGLPANANHTYNGSHTAITSDNGNPLPLQYVDPTATPNSNTGKILIEIRART